MSIIVQYDRKHLIPHQNLSLLPQFCTHRLVRSRRCTDVHRPVGLNPSHNPHLKWERMEQYIMVNELMYSKINPLSSLDNFYTISH